jgi:hypothetical protein
MASQLKHRLISGGGLGTALLLGLGIFVSSPQASAATTPGSPGVVALSKTPIAADSSWQGNVESNGAPSVAPVAIASASGGVTNAQALVTGSGTATLTDVAGQAPPTLVLDYGKEVGGLPFFNVSSAAPSSPATSVTLRSGYSEAKQYLFGAPPATTLAAAASAGATNVSVNSVNGFFTGEPLTIGAGATQQSATITAVGTPAASLKMSAAASPGDTNVKVTSVANLTAGSPIIIDPGPNQEQATITSVGTAGVNSTLTAGTVTTPGLPVPSYTGASFLWNAPGFTSSAPTGTIFVRRDFTLTANQLTNMTDAVVRANVDDQYTLFVNGVQVAASTVANGWQTSQLADVKSLLVAGNNVIAIAPYNVSGAGGFIAALQMDFTPAAGVAGNQTLIQTEGDGSWLASELNAPACTTASLACIASSAPAGWANAGFDDSAWPPIPAGDAAAYPVSPWNTLATPSVPQPDIISVASSAGFTAGDTIVIDPGTANQESDTIASVAAGSLTLAANLSIVHSTGTAVLDESSPGTGVTFTPALTRAHAVLSGIASAGTGITFTPALTQAYPSGTSLTTAATSITGDANGNNGVGTDGSRADNFTLTAATGGTTIGNAVTAVQGGERFQAIQLTTPGTVTLSSLGITVKFDNVGPSAYNGYFLSSDDTLNKIWYAGAYTAQTDAIPPGDVCSNATTCSTTPAILDGAKRDRRVWSGDLSVEGRTMFDSLGFGPNGSDYIKDSIAGYGSAPAANGSTCGQTSNWVPLPAAPVSCSFYSATYSMYYVLDLAEYYLYSGDTAFAESQYQVMKNELAYNATSVDPATGLTTVAGSDWDFYDGSKGGTAAQGGAVTATNVTYYETLADAAWLASQLAASDPGNASAATWTADAAKWSAQAAALKTSINTHLFNTGLGVYQLSSSSNGTHAATAVPQDANAEAVVDGVAPSSDVSGILAYLKDNLWGTYGPQPYSPDANYSTVVSPFVTGYELDARFAAGDTSNALTLTDLMWAQMVSQQGPFYTGTLWEKLGQNGQDTDSNASLAHGWATAPVSAFSGYLLGIQPTGPGYSTWTIAPQPGNLSWAQGQVPTPPGTPVVSRWQAGANTSSFKLTMSAPAGTSGTVAIPELGSSRVIAEDGKIVWAGGAPANGISASEANGAVVFANVSGAHTFAWAATITPADLCTLTKEYVDSSANYQSLKPVQQEIVDALVTATCTFLTSILPNLTPAKKQAFIKSYDQAVQGLVKKGWLTQAQSSTLQSLASTL